MLDRILDEYRFDSNALPVVALSLDAACALVYSIFRIRSE